MSLQSILMKAFGKPEGRIGELVGWVLANRPSNRARINWTVNLLRLRPGLRVLDFGCGPGLALKAISAQGATAVGIDHSDVMRAQAARRMATTPERTIIAGDLGEVSGRFDRIMMVNVIQFVPDQADLVAKLAARLVPGGLLAITHQPRQRNATRADAVAMADHVEAWMTQAGLDVLSREELPLTPAPAIAVLGQARSL